MRSFRIPRSFDFTPKLHDLCAQNRPNIDSHHMLGTAVVDALRQVCLFFFFRDLRKVEMLNMSAHSMST